MSTKSLDNTVVVELALLKITRRHRRVSAANLNHCICTVAPHVTDVTALQFCFLPCLGTMSLQRLQVPSASQTRYRPLDSVFARYDTESYHFVSTSGDISRCEMRLLHNLNTVTHGHRGFNWSSNLLNWGLMPEEKTIIIFKFNKSRFRQEMCKRIIAFS